MKIPDTTACIFCGRDRLDLTWKHKGDEVRIGDGGVALSCFELRTATYPPMDTDCPREMPS